MTVCFVRTAFVLAPLLTLTSCGPSASEHDPGTIQKTAASVSDSTSPALDPLAIATLPLPESQRDGAAILLYDGDGNLTPARDGSNGLVCLGDKPDDDRIASACYHESLEPFMARGRALSAEGIGGADRYRIRHEEMDAGTLPAPHPGATLYNMSIPAAEFDPATAKPSLYSIYIPGITAESTGLPGKPAHPGAPWVMRSGTPSAHIMVISVE